VLTDWKHDIVIIKPEIGGVTQIQKCVSGFHSHGRGITKNTVIDGAWKTISGA
jgi:hypothetical protein